MKVLIIDDSRTMRRLLASYLANIATAIIEAEDGVQALEQLNLNAPIDLALVDWDMPRMNGLDFVKAVRADAAFAEMKILMVTSHNTMEDVGAALEAGATDFLMKPMTEDMVTDKLRVLGMID
jgi:two-component system chemotaxis response regulator CheY